MKQPLWQRRRRRIEDDPHRERDEGVSMVPDPAPAAPRSATQPTLRKSLMADALDSVEGPAPGPDREAAYAAWAERMRSHKKDKLAHIAEAQAEAAEAEKPGTSPYWDVANLFVETGGESATEPKLMETSQLLDILELAPDPTPEQIQASYRRLVKEHHPDRWVSAPEQVREQHANRMSLISEAHRELRRRSS